jgi:hypothetical protein
MALTIRTTEAEDIIIDRAMTQFGFNTKSKALIQCVPMALKLREDKKQLERELRECREELAAIKDAYEHKMMADSVLAKLLQAD